MVDLQRKTFQNVNILHSLCGMYKVLKHRCSLLSFLPWTRRSLGGLPHLEKFKSWQIVTPADRVTLPGRPGNPPRRSPHLSCKRDQDKIRNYMDRRVTPLRRVTSPTWGPPPPCKQALRQSKNGITCLWFHLGICVHGNNLQSLISTNHLFWNALWFSSEFPCTCRLSNAGRSP